MVDVHYFVLAHLKGGSANQARVMQSSPVDAIVEDALPTSSYQRTGLAEESVLVNGLR